MPRKTLLHFNGTTQLAGVRNMPRAEYEVLSHDPSAYFTGKRDYSDRVRVGFLPRPKPALWGEAQEPTTIEHTRPLLVERSIKVIATDAPHVCDWRCEGAKKGSECRCSCGGRNHGIKGAAHPAM